MVFNEVKQKFESISDINTLIDTKLEEVSELRRRLTDVKSTSYGDKVQSTKDPDKFTNTIAKIIELENEVNEDINRLVDNKRECRKLIETLENNLYKAVLYKIYFESKSNRVVGYECNKSVRQIVNIKNKAIVQIAEISEK